MDATCTIDAKGQACPMPVLMLAKAARQARPGDIMLVEATDEAARSDIPAWARMTGNDLLDSADEGGVLRFWIQKG